MTSPCHFSLVASICVITALATNLAVEPPEVVFRDTGAGGIEFTTVPAGAMTSIGFSAP